MKTLVIGGEQNGIVLHVDNPPPNPVNLPLHNAMTSDSDAKKGIEWREKFNWYRLVNINIYLEEGLKREDLIDILSKGFNGPPKTKAPEVLTVRIIKSKKSTFWYSNNIGDLFEVTPKKGDPARYQVSPYDGGNIHQEDAEIIPDYDHSEYRLMARGEKVEEYDLSCSGFGWQKSANYLDRATGRKQSLGFIYIRPLKPAIAPVEARLTKCEDRLTELDRRLDAV